MFVADNRKLNDPFLAMVRARELNPTIFVQCFEMGTLTHTNEMRVILDSLGKYRQGFFRLFIYDWISIPLVCTEVTYSDI